MNAKGIILKYIDFFERRGHKRIPNSPLVPENDPTTLFTSAGMQALIPNLLGEPHPQGKRLVNVQNCFRAADIDEVGDSSHTTFFRMLGNWSLGDYFKREEIGWLWEFLTEELRLPKEKLYITVFGGEGDIPYDHESEEIWKKIFEKDPRLNSEQGGQRIFAADATKNWWSRSGVPDDMPPGEIGGPDTEVYYKFENVKHSDKCSGDDPTKCECGKFLEIANSVFIQYKKTEKGFEQLPQKNVDFGGGLERLLAAVENKSDIFQTTLFTSILQSIEEQTGKKYKENQQEMRIITDHFVASTFIINSNIKPSNKEQGYILRRLIRRGLDNFYKIEGVNIEKVIETITDQYQHTDPDLLKNFEAVKNIILEEEGGYKRTLNAAKKFISKRYPLGDELKGGTKISADDAFLLYSTHGLSPTQIRSLGYVFDELDFADKMEEHGEISKKGASRKFAGGLADHSEQTIKGHSATHLLHQAIRDLLGTTVHQKGSNITSERLRFDFNLDRNLTPEEISKLEQKVNEKIEENLPVFYEFMPLEKAKEIGAIGLFDEKYEGEVKVYLIGSKDPGLAYSKEFCGGPHVSFTRQIKSFKIIKQDNIGMGLRRLYARVS